MRLSDRERQEIRDTVREICGPAAAVWLFGSRVDDAGRGGDIDLLVETTMADAEAVMDAKLQLLVRLKQRLGDQRIDLVLAYPGQAPLPRVIQIARATGIPL